MRRAHPAPSRPRRRRFREGDMHDCPVSGQCVEDVDENIETDRADPAVPDPRHLRARDAGNLAGPGRAEVAFAKDAEDRRQDLGLQRLRRGGRVLPVRERIVGAANEFEIIHSTKPPSGVSVSRG